MLSPARCSNSHRAWIILLANVAQSVRKYFWRSFCGVKSSTVSRTLSSRTMLFQGRPAVSL
jgi:hypothetical protein